MTLKKSVGSFLYRRKYSHNLGIMLNFAFGEGVKILFPKEFLPVFIESDMGQFLIPAVLGNQLDNHKKQLTLFHILI